MPGTLRGHPSSPKARRSGVAGSFPVGVSPPGSGASGNSAALWHQRFSLAWPAAEQSPAAALGGPVGGKATAARGGEGLGRCHLLRLINGARPRGAVVSKSFSCARDPPTCVSCLGAGKKGPARAPGTAGEAGRAPRAAREGAGCRRGAGPVPLAEAAETACHKSVLSDGETARDETHAARHLLTNCRR